MTLKSFNLTTQFKLWSKAALAIAAVATMGSAQAEQDNKYFEIGSIKIETRDITITDEISGEHICSACRAEEYSLNEWNQKQESAQLRREKILKEFGLNNDSGGDFTLDQIINYGAKLWKLIEKNKPVSNFATVNANALPAKVDGDWLALENWQAPKGRIYSVIYENLYGAEVVRFDYRMLFSSGGSHNGVGQYLSNVSVNPQTLSVAWGYNVEAVAKVVNVINTSSKANPVAGMEVLVDWRVKTVMKDIRSTTSFFIKGDGSFIDLND
jgi:hypothetical protein